MKHTRKHKKGRKELNQKAKHKGSGGPSGQKGRTVRTGHADRPHWPRGPSGLLPRTVRTNTVDCPSLRRGPSDKTHRTTRDAPRITDRPQGARGLSARHPRIVRPLLRTVQNLSHGKLKATTDRNERRARTRRTPDEQARRGPSARTTRTVREARTEQKNSPTSKVNSPKSSSDFPNG
jgi:hypothetical protein